MLALALVSIVSLLNRARGRGASPGLMRFRLVAALLFWALLTLWAGIAAVMVGIAGLVGGTGLGLLVSLAIILIWGLFCTALWFWVRGNIRADAGWLLVIILFCGNVYYWQRAWICEPLAFSGFGPAQLCTAKLYESGSGGVIRNRQTARAWYGYAAERGIAEAQYEVGLFTRDRAKKEQWLVRAADQGNSDAAVELYFLWQRSDEGVVRLRQASEAGHTSAHYYLGNHYLYGTGGLERDLARVRKLWTEAAESGNPQAMQALAIAWARGGILFNYSDEKSRHWERQAQEAAQDTREMRPLERSFAVNWERTLQDIRAQRTAAEADDVQAMLAIGHDILKQAQEDHALIEKGMSWVVRAAAAGSAKARYEAADYYLEQGQSNASVQAEGRNWLVAAADSGHEKALRRLIEALKAEDDGFQRDLDGSRRYSEALFALLDARGVRPNQTPWMSASWEYTDTLKQIRREQEQYLPPQELKRQAEAGDAIAQYHLGKERMRTDFAAGVSLLVASANAGYAQAQYEMAQRIRHRKRTPEEEAQAITWLHESESAGHRGAMVDLGILYLQGLARQGIDKNPYRARLLFEASLRGVDEIVYEQKRSGGSWQYTVKSVNRWLDRIPESIKRLQLDNLHGEARRKEIVHWYERENERLHRQLDEASGEEATDHHKELELIEQQFNVMLEASPS